MNASIPAAICILLGGTWLTSCSDTKLSETIGNQLQDKDIAKCKEALAEVRKLKSGTEAGITLFQYSDLTLKAKIKIDEVFHGSPNSEIKDAIYGALENHLEARNDWSRYGFNDFVQAYWLKANDKILMAERLIAADPEKYSELIEEESLRIKMAEEEKQKVQKELDDANIAAANARLRAEAEQRAKEDALEKKYSAERRKAMELAFEEEKNAISARRLADEAKAKEDERIEFERRYTPKGVVINLRPISFSFENGIKSIQPGLEFEVVGKAGEEKITVRRDGMETEANAALFTNDRDLAEIEVTNYLNNIRNNYLKAGQAPSQIDQGSINRDPFIEPQNGRSRENSNQNLPINPIDINRSPYRSNGTPVGKK